MEVEISATPFDPTTELQHLLQQCQGKTGAICSFVGLVRDYGDRDGLLGLFLEHYPGMTEKALIAIIDEARTRWPLQAVRIVHRVGELGLNDPIVFVGVSSGHRVAAFEACAFLMDYLKVKAPFWKKERLTEGDHWVAQKSSDEDHAARWQTSNKPD